MDKEIPQAEKPAKRAKLIPAGQCKTESWEIRYRHNKMIGGKMDKWDRKEGASYSLEPYGINAHAEQPYDESGPWFKLQIIVVTEEAPPRHHPPMPMSLLKKWAVTRMLPLDLSGAIDKEFHAPDTAKPDTYNTALPRALLPKKDDNYVDKTLPPCCLHIGGGCKNSEIHRRGKPNSPLFYNDYDATPDTPATRARLAKLSAQEKHEFGTWKDYYSWKVCLRFTSTYSLQMPWVLLNDSLFRVVMKNWDTIRDVPWASPD